MYKIDKIVEDEKQSADAKEAGMNISIDVKSHAEPVLTSQLFSCDLLYAESRRNELAFEQIQSAFKSTFLVVRSAIAKFLTVPIIPLSHKISPQL